MHSAGEILSIMRKAKPVLEKNGLTKLGLFGSYARNEQQSSSDIDILLDFKQGCETYDNFLHATSMLEQMLPGYKLQFVTVKGLSKHIGPYILKEVVYA
jgi:uncharacterized protein